MLASKTNITEDKIVLRYEKTGDKLDLLFFFKQCSASVLTKPDRVKALWLRDA
jgi:hypothetical protein